MKKIFPTKLSTPSATTRCLAPVMLAILSSLTGTPAAQAEPVNSLIHQDLQVPPPANSEQALTMIRNAVHQVQNPQLTPLDARVPDYRPTYRLLQTTATYAITQYLEGLATIQQKVGLYFSRLYELKRQAQQQGPGASAFQAALRQELSQASKVQAEVASIYQKILGDLTALYGYGFFFTDVKANSCKSQAQRYVTCMQESGLFLRSLGAAEQCATYVCADQIKQDQLDWERFVDRLNVEIVIRGKNAESLEPAALTHEPIQSAIVRGASVEAISKAIQLPQTATHQVVLLSMTHQAARTAGTLNEETIPTILAETTQRWQAFHTKYLADLRVSITLPRLSRPVTPAYRAELVEINFRKKMSDLPSADFDPSDDAAEVARRHQIVDQTLSTLEQKLFGQYTPPPSDSDIGTGLVESGTYRFSGGKTLPNGLILYTKVTFKNERTGDWLTFSGQEQFRDFCKLRGHHDTFSVEDPSKLLTERDYHWTPNSHSIYCVSDAAQLPQFLGDLSIDSNFRLVITRPRVSFLGSEFYTEYRYLSERFCEKLGKNNYIYHQHDTSYQGRTPIGMIQPKGLTSLKIVSRSDVDYINEITCSPIQK